MSESGTPHEDAGQPYQPANGSEGADFMCAWCDRCLRDKGMRQDPQTDGCEIIALSMIHTPDEPGYPPQMVYDAAGRPSCTAFEEDPDPEGQTDATLLARKQRAYDQLPRDPVTGRPII